jgi:hypothetical protein
LRLVLVWTASFICFDLAFFAGHPPLFLIWMINSFFNGFGPVWKLYTYL